MNNRRKLAPAARLAALTLALGASSALGQSYVLVGPNPEPFQYLTGGTVLSAIQTYQGENINLPFSFRFYGQTYSSVTVSLYGYLVMSGGATSSSNYGIPHSQSSTYIPATFISPWWDTAYKATASPVTTVRWQASGTSPQQVVTVEWRDLMPISSSGTQRISFQVKLYESTGQIRFTYAPNPVFGTVSPSASVGIQGALNQGVAGLTCTTAASGNCNAANWPGNAAIDFFLPPDLVTANLTGDQTGYAGVGFRASAILRNVGGRDATQGTVRFFLSSDTTLDSGDAQLSTTTPKDLRPFEEALVTAAGPIPSATVPGNYFLIAKADPDNSLVELDENNNVSLPMVIKVGPPTPDLVVSTVTGPTSAQPGQSMSVNRIFTNVGNAAAATFKYTYFISDNSVVTISDRAMTPAGSGPALNPNESNTAADTITVPSDLPAGRYWIGVCADYDSAATPTSVVSEISEVNNCATAPSSFVNSTGVLTVLTTSLPAATQFSPYGLTLQATGGDGAGSYGWSITGGQLPPGVTLSQAGDLLGSPSSPGAFSFDVKVTSGSASANASLSLQVTPANLPLAVVDQELPTAEFSRAFSARLIAVGGKPPYIWSLKQDSRLPIGLALSTDGVVEGRASEAGEIPFSVEVTDSVGSKAGKDLRVRVVTPSSMHIATARFTTGYLKKEYMQPLQAVGGKKPYAWSITKFQQLAENPTEAPTKPAQALPADFGLKIEKDPATGQDVLKGVPAKAGLFAIGIRVQDDAGNEDITTLPLQVSYEEGLAVTTLALPDAFVGHPYAARLSHNGGSSATDILFALPCVKQVQQNLEDFACAAVDAAQQLPPGLALGPDGSITGTPTAPAAAGKDGQTPVVFSFLVKVSDGAGRQDVRGISVKVRPDYAPKSGGCSGTALAPSAFALLLSLRLLRRRR